MIRRMLLRILCAIAFPFFLIPIGCKGDILTQENLQSGYELFFVEDCPTAHARSVTIQSNSQVAEKIESQVVITDVPDVYGACFQLTFDPEKIDVTVTEGDFLNKDGSETELTVNNESPGSLIIKISRMRVSYGMDAVGSEILLKLSFQHKKVEGKAVLTLKNSHLLDSSQPPREIPNLAWCSGSVIIIVRV
jgi:hypothetical protein